VIAKHLFAALIVIIT